MSSPFCTVKGITRLKGLSMDSIGSTGTTGSSVACGKWEGTVSGWRRPGKFDLSHD